MRELCCKLGRISASRESWEEFLRSPEYLAESRRVRAAGRAPAVVEEEGILLFPFLIFFPSSSLSSLESPLCRMRVLFIIFLE
ncbi:hypothetical protein KFK09_003504 [Dendrobium nobile]|uniref:Uncharacterized protein n=1 Tax=Dendrobium nobile TaxID=94219 RepID=A0A8T3C1G7_DENNO|nr:hypothetical protein KFK09_003504 [Dendrobium nobile]